MKTRLIFAFAAGLLLMPALGYAEAIKGSSDAPPVAPTLVREGDFSVKLVETLKMTKVEDEALAENKLAEIGIAPANGWISDYPVTPVVMGDIRDSVARAADAGKIALSKDEALIALNGLEASLGLPIVAAGGDEANVSSTDYESPEAVDEYYDEQGPPVMTYYAPPWDYYYLYDWVPYPFFTADFFFPGFFVLRNFHTPVVVINARAVILNARLPILPGVRRVLSNTVINPVTGRPALVNPAARQLVGITPRNAPAVNGRAASNWTPAGRQAAQSIIGRDIKRTGGAAPSPMVRNEPNRSFSSPSPLMRGTPNRSYSAPSPMMRGGPARSFSSSGPTVQNGPARSFSAPGPTVRGEPVRSFGAPPARSFSAPRAMPFGGPRGGGFGGGRGGCAGGRC